MDVLEQLAKTFFDWEAMGEVIPAMLTVGLPNTLILAVSSAFFGCVLGMVLAVMGISRNPFRAGSPGSTRIFSAACQPF